MDGFLGELLEHMMENRSETYTYSDIERLQDDEEKEWNLINAQVESLKKRLEAIKDESEYNDARRRMFWYSMRKRHGLQDEESLKIENGMIQKGVK